MYDQAAADPHARHGLVAAQLQLAGRAAPSVPPRRPPPAAVRIAGGETIRTSSIVAASARRVRPTFTRHAR